MVLSLMLQELHDACQEIRNVDIRDEGKMLVKKFDHEYPKRFLRNI